MNKRKTRKNWSKYCADCKQSLGDKKNGYVPYTNFKERGVYCNECEPNHATLPLMVAWYSDEYKKARILYIPPTDDKTENLNLPMRSPIKRILKETWFVDMSEKESDD